MPRESDLEDQWELITGLPEDWGKQGLQSWRAQTQYSRHQDPGEGNSNTTETEPDPPASAGGSPVEPQVRKASPQGWGRWQQQS